MNQLKGLYMSLPDCGHTYGIQAINNDRIYDCLFEYWRHNNQGKWFLQGNSAHGTGDKEWLYIEFLGQSLDDDSALAICEEIARVIGCELQIL
jgi:hypothetical protein